MINAKEALQKLIDGNERFVNNASIHPNRSQETKDSLLSKQTPFAIVLSCSDSRVPLEIIFDAGLGDIFVIRTAGHVLSQEVMGSIEYGVVHLGVKLIMILGHDNCGAVHSAVDAYKSKSLDTVSPNLKSILMEIYPAIEKVNSDLKEEDFHKEAVRQNVEYQAKDLLIKDAYIANKVSTGEIMVVKANYNLSTSRVEIF
ncbi:carbonic anhydrase [bacterium]|nr:carbonic anhydrase [bacterium]